MALAQHIETARLLLRPWKLEDREPFAAMNADPRVREHFPGLLSRAESDASVRRIEAHFAEHGFGFWAVELPGVAQFIGMVGLAVVTFPAHFTPAVEIGWRLAAEHWGHGFATEAARAALDFGFNELQLKELVSFTVPTNVRSRRVMEKLGMMHDLAGDFEHPSITEGHPLRRHVLYRINNTSL